MSLPHSRSWVKRTWLEVGWPYRRGQVNLVLFSVGAADLIPIEVDMVMILREKASTSK